MYLGKLTTGDSQELGVPTLFTPVWKVYAHVHCLCLCMQTYVLVVEVMDGEGGSFIYRPV